MEISFYLWKIINRETNEILKCGVINGVTDRIYPHVDGYVTPIEVQAYKFNHPELGIEINLVETSYKEIEKYLSKR